MTDTMESDVSRSVIERVFRILRAFDGKRSELSLAELTERTGLPKATLHRMLKQLVAVDALEASDIGYRLGIAMFELGGLVPRQSRLREVALPFIEDLYEATRHTIHFGILDGVEVLYIERIRGHTRVAVPTRTGGRLPAYSTGVGKALLAFSPPDVIEAVIDAGLEAHTPFTITRPGRLREVLGEIAAEGVAFDREEGVIGVTCVAAPILDRSHRPVAAISATTSPDRIAWDRLAYAVKATSLALSREVQRMPDSFWGRNERTKELLDE